MTKPVISVIMPAFKSESTIARAMDSFLNQDIKVPCEMIIGISYSDTETFEVAKKYSEEHKEIKLHIEEKRMGQAFSRYKAILDSQGEYIYFMDADDELAKNCLSKFFETITKTDADCVNASFYEVNSNGKKKYPFAKNSKLDGNQAISALFADSFFRGFLWTKMWKRKVFESRPLLLISDKEDMFEDVVFCASALSYCKRIVTMKDPLYLYYKNIPTSATSQKRTDRAMRHLWAFALARHFFESTGKKEFAKSFGKKHFRSWLSLLYDLSLDKKAGATKGYVKQVKDEWKIVANMKKPLPLEGRSYSDILKRGWLR